MKDGDHVSIPHWSDFNPIGPTRGSPRAALPQVPWRAPFIKVHGPGILPRWAGFARKWEIGAIGAVSSRFARRAPRYPDRPRRAGPQRVQGRRRARRREILAGPSRPCAHLSSLRSRRPIEAIRDPGARGRPTSARDPSGVPENDVQTDVGPIANEFFRPSPGPAGSPPRRGAIDAKSGEPVAHERKLSSGTRGLAPVARFLPIG